MGRWKHARCDARGWLRVASIAALGCSGSELPDAPREIAACCDGRGACLPSTFLDQQSASLLGVEQCPAASMCVPDELRSVDVPPMCRVSLNGAEGRCLPSCLPAVAALGDQLRSDGCAQHQRCVPCYDPIDGDVTHACEQGNDIGPSEPPRTFAPCCEGVGRCVPRMSLPEAQRDDLGPDSCEDGALCAPLAAIEQGAAYVPTACFASLLGAEGRCLPACLPQLAEQRDQLRADGCEAGHLCAPCFDPLSGEPTGACELGSDPGPREDAVPLASCCGGVGHCVNPELVPAAQHEQLGVVDCANAEQLCVPDAFTKPDYSPTVCTAASTGSEGRCLPACLPQLAGQVDRLARDGCEAGNLCAPCIDPLSGKPTGACELGTDRGPSAPVVLFGRCCGGRARCVPEGLIAEAQRGQLGQDSCADDAELCVPNALAESADFVPAPCTVSALGVEGRCLSTCLPAAQEQSDLFEQDGCAGGELCLPCFDPLRGEPTGACDFAGDPGPKQPAETLSDCCTGLGRCAPEAWIPEGLVSNFGADTCTAPDQLCVAPEDALEDPTFVPTSCEVPGLGAEGRCLPSCLPAVAARADTLGQGACPDAHLCVPCFDPITGAVSGACGFGADPGPTRPAVVFEACCAGEQERARGLCVPSTLVPEGAPALPREGCSAPDAVCAPRSFVEAPTASFPKCRSASATDGVCIASCHLEGVALAVVLRGSCASDERCVPCSLAGDAIGGC
jgi:hypothetical protein